MEPEQGTVLRMHGEVDDEACAAVRRELAPLLADGLRHLVLDLSEVTALQPVAVALLGSLDRHLRRQQGGLLLVHAPAAVQRTLAINDLDGLLSVRDLPPAVPRPPRAADPQRPPLPDVIPLHGRARVARR